MYQVKEKRNRRPEELSNRELFQRGLKGWLDNEQTSALYKEFKDNLKSFRTLTLEELESKGMSKKDAFKLSALLELFQRSQADENAYREQIMSSQQVARRLMSEIGGEHARTFESVLFRCSKPYHSRRNGFYRGCQQVISRTKGNLTLWG